MSAPLPLDWLNVKLVENYCRHLDGKSRALRDEDADLRDPCSECDGMSLPWRIRIDYSKGVGCVEPCPRCRPRAFTAFHARMALHTEPAEHFCCGYYLGHMRDCPTCKAECLCEGCKADRVADESPPTLRSGYRDADPWSLADEELNETAPLPREVPAYWGRARDDADLNDDKADLAAHTVTTVYPWGGRNGE